MLWAKSIRFGGELINAEDCDYGSYKDLGLICSECGNLVFLVKSQTRESKKGKAFKVPAHFSHFKEAESIAGHCELRVKNYSQKDFEKASSIARNQRLKFFQNWFWATIQDLDFVVAIEYSFSKKKLYFDLFDRPLKNFLEQYDLISSEPFYSAFVEEIQFISELVRLNFKNNREVFVSTWLDILLELNTPNLLKKDTQSFKKRATEIVSLLKVRLSAALHKKIALEALEFALSSRNKYQLGRLLFTCMLILSEKHHKDIVELLNKNKKDSIATCCYYLLSLVFLVPWAKKFEEEKER